MRPLRPLPVLLATCCLWACAINPAVQLDQLGEALPSDVSLAVPFHPQTELQCGPAALATVLGASGEAVEPAQLTPLVFLPERGGSLQVELLAASRTHGRIPFQLSPEVDDLLEELAAGRPVLVLQNLGTRSLPHWHYAVLTGFQRDQNRFRLNSGRRENLWLNAPEFLRTWDWAGRWAMVTLPPGAYPASADQSTDPARYLGPVVDFEAVAGGSAAAPAWRAASQRWPEAPLPSLALGNLAYRQGDLERAIHWYGKGLSHNADDPVLANNLATVLGEAGCARAGERVLAPFTATPGRTPAWEAAIAGSLGELARKPGRDPDSCAALAW